MRTVRRLALLLILPTASLAAQEYQLGAAFTRVSTAFDWRDNTGAPPAYVPAAKSAMAPSLFADLQAPLLTLKGFMGTADAGLRWPLGSDVGVITLGLGVAHAIEDGYAGLHYLHLSPVNGTKVLDQDWGIGTEGFQAIVRHGAIRVDLKRTVDHIRQVSGYGTDVRTNTRMAAAVRWRMLGVELERWREDMDMATGARSFTDLNRVSVFMAIGQYPGSRGLW